MKLFLKVHPTAPKRKIRAIPPTLNIAWPSGQTDRHPRVWNSMFYSYFHGPSRLKKQKFREAHPMQDAPPCFINRLFSDIAASLRDVSMVTALFAPEIKTVARRRGCSFSCTCKYRAIRDNRPEGFPFCYRGADLRVEALMSNLPCIMSSWINHKSRNWLFHAKQGHAWLTIRLSDFSRPGKSSPRTRRSRYLHSAPF